MQCWVMCGLTMTLSHFWMLDWNIKLMLSEEKKNAIWRLSSSVDAHLYRHRKKILPGMLKLALLAYVCHLSAVAFGVNVGETHTQKLHTNDDVYGRENCMKKAKIMNKEEKKHVLYMWTKPYYWGTDSRPFGCDKSRKWNIKVFRGWNNHFSSLPTSFKEFYYTLQRTAAHQE